MLRDGSWVCLLGLVALALGAFTMGFVYLLPHNILGAMLFVVVGLFVCAVIAVALNARRKRYGDGPTTDEREERIRMRGDNAGMLAFMVFWAGTCIAFIVGTRMRHAEALSVQSDSVFGLLIVSLVLYTLVRTLVIRQIRKKELSDGQG
jgi:Na+/proline symporter